MQSIWTEILLMTQLCPFSCLHLSPTHMCRDSSRVWFREMGEK